MKGNRQGYGYKPHFVEGSDPEALHQSMASGLDTVIAEIKAMQRFCPVSPEG
ncbi:MAG: hypothetical protein GTO24_04095 [candidate division Zixibacteria bacterium]|nr:hypothetical protein [candidate division Zixibacteria bacterium]